jgi:glucose-1-phosphate cytidylyltransferase
MQVVLLAGGFGTRLAEETERRPKPMVEIGEFPILWHIMRHYSVYGHNEFFVLLGYKGEYLKRYFVDRAQLAGDLTVAGSGVVTRRQTVEPWTVHLIDTGLSSLTGSRVKRVAPYLDRKTFLVTYGDGVSDVPVDALVDFHRRCGKLATLTAVRPPARFGGIVFDGEDVIEFIEKPQIGEGWINGGFFVFEPEVIDYLSDDGCSLEVDLLERLARDRQLAAYRHEGFWQCVDTLRELRLLRSLWDSGKAPWKTWE